MKLIKYVMAISLLLHCSGVVRASDERGKKKIALDFRMILRRCDNHKREDEEAVAFVEKHPFLINHVHVLDEMETKYQTPYMNGITSLYYAAAYNLPNLVRKLLFLGADSEAKPGNNETTLMMAADSIYKGVRRSRWYDGGYGNYRVSTPLKNSNDQAAILDMLLYEKHRGSIGRYRQRYGTKANPWIDIAHSMGYKRRMDAQQVVKGYKQKFPTSDYGCCMASFLWEVRCYKPNMSLMRALEASLPLECLNVILAYEPYDNDMCPSCDGTTALSHASNYKKMENGKYVTSGDATKLLLSKGALPNQSFTTYGSPLSQACKHINGESVAPLLAAGAKIDNTALLYASMYMFEKEERLHPCYQHVPERKKIISSLIAAGGTMKADDLKKLRADTNPVVQEICDHIDKEQFDDSLHSLAALFVDIK